MSSNSNRLHVVDVSSTSTMIRSGLTCPVDALPTTKFAVPRVEDGATSAAVVDADIVIVAPSASVVDAVPVKSNAEMPVVIVREGARTFLNMICEQVRIPVCVDEALTVIPLPDGGSKSILVNVILSIGAPAVNSFNVLLATPGVS